MLDTLPSLEELETELARRMSLAEFVQASWHVLEPSTPLTWGWHMQAICDHVESLLVGWMRSQSDRAALPDVQNAIVCVPPGSSKSRISSVCAPAWLWVRHPAARIQAMSANPRIAVRDSVLCRDLISSDWYQHTFRPRWKLKDDQNSKTLFSNTVGGTRSAFGAGAKITGARADVSIFDDLIDARDRHSSIKRESVNDWLSSAAFSRVNDERRSLRLMIGQRLHVEDPVGYVMDRLPGRWEMLVIPQEWEETQRRTTWLGWSDPRTQEGELMCPERFDSKSVEDARKLLGAAEYAAQHQQRPAPASGNIFQRDWLNNRWKSETLPPRFDTLWVSVDPANAESPTSYVVIQLWGSLRGQRWLLDQVRGRLSPMTTEQAIRDGVARWREGYGRVDAIIVEAKAAGPGVMERLRQEIPGVLAWPPKGAPMGSKEERAAGVEPQVASGNVIIPDPSMPGFGWVHDFVEEVVTFPFYGSDDQVDAMTQALSFASQRTARVISITADLASMGARRSPARIERA